MIINKNTQRMIVLLYIVLGLIFVFQMSRIDTQYVPKYIMVLISYFYMVGIWMLYICKFGFYLFEPVTMVAILTILTFSIEPMISMIADDTLLAGFNVYGGCVKATLIYMLALTVFFFVYYNRFTFGEKRYHSDLNTWDGDYDKSKKLIVLAYTFTVVGIAVSLVDLIKQGFSLQYILSLGSGGSFDAKEESIGVFINLRYMMLPGFLYLDLYTNKKILNNFLRIIAVACMFMRNKRWIIVLIILSPIALHYIQNKKKPSVKILVSTALFMALLIGAMQYMRGMSTSISSVDWSSFNLLSIWKAFSGNFDLYKTLYAAVVYFPDEHFYTMGQQLIYLTLVTCIPRAIWPNKPVSIIDSQLKPYFMGNGAVRGAWAYAQLTEFYIEFGIAGVVICMGVFAGFCKFLKKCTFRPKNIHELVMAATFYPMLMQLVIRGYMPINFWAIFFMMIPITVIRAAEKVR